MRHHIAVFDTKIYNRLLVPLTAADQLQAPPDLCQALRTLDHHVGATPAALALNRPPET